MVALINYSLIRNRGGNRAVRGGEVDMNHSWHHQARWPECHPYAYRKYRQRRRRALWAGLLALVAFVIMGVRG